MFDKIKRKATAQRCGDIVVIRMVGGPDCLWLNMYLDTEAAQMTCDSDIGFYSYHWGRSILKNRDFVSFCCEWLADENWLLRKCIREQHVAIEFDKTATVESMCEMFKEYYADEDDETPDYEGMLEEICYDDRDSWCAALVYSAPSYGVYDLPEEWWECIVEDYTPWQKRFAEICREVIVPELEKLDGRKNSMPEWISVKDRLPEEGENRYLVRLEDGFIGTAVWDDGWELWNDSGEVTHWMCLPEPPKEG